MGEGASLLGGHMLKRVFAEWMSKHSKNYADEAEFENRYKVFQANHKFIEQENAKGLSYKLGHNEFSDLTHEEFKAFALGGPMKHTPGVATNHEDEVEDDGEQSVDWRTKGAVTEVKNQGQCGSCWAFSTTGAMEGAHFIATGKLVELSEQELVDCDTAQDQGCNGGLMDYAFTFAEKNGLASESDYPYHAARGTCDTSAEAKPAATISSYADVTQNSEKALRQAVKQQPVSVAIEADQQAFQFYSSGIFDAECGTQLDHGVLAVGYDYKKGGVMSKGSGFWIVKNSWGATWGENGYIRLAMGKGASGQCGIAMQPSYPIV